MKHNIVNYRRICRYMTFAVAKILQLLLLAVYMIIANNLYHNIALNDILKLQCVPNSLARVSSFLSLITTS